MPVRSHTPGDGRPMSPVRDRTERSDRVSTEGRWGASLLIPDAPDPNAEVRRGFDATTRPLELIELNAEFRDEPVSSHRDDHRQRIEAASIASNACGKPEGSGCQGETGRQFNSGKEGRSAKIGDLFPEVDTRFDEETLRNRCPSDIGVVWSDSRDMTTPRRRGDGDPAEGVSRTESHQGTRHAPGLPVVVGQGRQRGCIREGRAMYQEMSRGMTTTAPSGEFQAAGSWTGERASLQARRAANARKTSGRRRNIDPTTSERDYSRDEIEFMTAMQEYKRRSGRMFPTWSEVLEVLHDLGYQKPEAVDASSAFETHHRACSGA